VKRFLTRGLFPLSALLVMMIALQGCPGNGGGPPETVVETQPCPQKNDDAYPIIIKVADGAAFTEEPLENPDGADVSVTGADGLPSTLQWYNDSEYDVEIQFNEHYTWITLPSKTYSFVHRLNENLSPPLSMNYLIVATDLSAPPGTPDVDVGP
jgi:hypothetical protein